jgi:hypothetical protein
MKLNIHGKYKIIIALNAGEDKIALVKTFKGPTNEVVEWVVWNVDKECNCEVGAYYPAWDKANELPLFDEALAEFQRRVIRSIDAVQLPK